MAQTGSLDADGHDIARAVVVDVARAFVEVCRKARETQEREPQVKAAALAHPPGTPDGFAVLVPYLAAGMHPEALEQTVAHCLLVVAELESLLTDDERIARIEALEAAAEAMAARLDSAGV